MSDGIEIDDEAGRMTLTVGDVFMRATRNADDTWTLPDAWDALDMEPPPPARPGKFTRNQAITALTIEEMLATGVPFDDPRIRSLEEELTQ